jgi:hypothetical protein
MRTLKGLTIRPHDSFDYGENFGIVWREAVIEIGLSPRDHHASLGDSPGWQ